MSRNDVIQAIRDYRYMREAVREADFPALASEYGIEWVHAYDRADDLVRVVMRELDIKAFEVS